MRKRKPNKPMKKRKNEKWKRIATMMTWMQKETEASRERRKKADTKLRKKRQEKMMAMTLLIEKGAEVLRMTERRRKRKRRMRMMRWIQKQQRPVLLSAERWMEATMKMMTTTLLPVAPHSDWEVQMRKKRTKQKMERTTTS